MCYILIIDSDCLDRKHKWRREIMATTAQCKIILPGLLKRQAERVSKQKGNPGEMGWVPLSTVGLNVPYRKKNGPLNMKLNGEFCVQVKIEGGQVISDGTCEAVNPKELVKPLQFVPRK